MLETLVVFIEQQDKFAAAFYLILAKIIFCITLLPSSAISILAGAILGVYWGFLVSYIGNMIGASLAFFLARYLLKDFIQNKILKKYSKINEYEDKLFKNGLGTVIFLRVVPFFPTNLLNFLLGITEVKWKDYFIGTAFGIIPGTFLSVYFGESIKLLSWYNILFSLLGIMCLYMLGNYYKKQRR